MNIRNLRRKKTLVAGGIKSGKTHFVCVFVEKILQDDRESVLVLDFAPNLYRGVGGKMVLSEHPRLHYLTTRIDAPRLLGKDDREMRKLAEGNRSRIEEILDTCEETSADVLIINDVTLYLQAGNHERLAALMATFPTVLINAYYGQDFAESPLSLRERGEVESFMADFDQVFLMCRGRIIEQWRP